MKTLGKVGLVGRFRPLHNIAAALLDETCKIADEVIIGIGSSNKYNLRNPFTPEETDEMINTYLSKRHNNYKIIYIPDFGHIPKYKDGQKWRKYIKNSFGELDAFVSGNDYVINLLKQDYNIILPNQIIPGERWRTFKLPLKASIVRVEMAKDSQWQSLVPEEVADYLEKNNLVKRFQQEFSLECLAESKIKEYKRHESAAQEMLHTTEN